MAHSDPAEQDRPGPGEPCNRPGCTGTIDGTGFCTVDDLRPLPRNAPEPGSGRPLRPPHRAEPSPGRPGRQPGGTPGPDSGDRERSGDRYGSADSVFHVPSDPWYGLGLAEAVGRPEPGPPPVPADSRGPAAGGLPPLGSVVAGRYTILDRLGEGGYGTAFLAHDDNLRTHVVLKRLNRSSVAQIAERERDALVGLRHDSIVRILDYENDPQDGPHLVLEYVPGAPLGARPGDRLETLLAHGLRILQALDYLHARGVLHCDVSPTNVVRFREETSAGPRDRVRLIDFGAVRTQRDEGPCEAFNPWFAPPAGDPEHARPTEGFDLFCLGRTLRRVCHDLLGDDLPDPRLEADLPGHAAAGAVAAGLDTAAAADGTAPGVVSLRLLLARATDEAVPEGRFASARQFAEQLSGVIRQVVSAPGLQQWTRPSALFGTLPAALHGGLGTPRPLDDWVWAAVTETAAGGTGASADGEAAAGAGDVVARLELPEPFTTPDRRSIVAALPTPVTDPYAPRLPGPAARKALDRTRTALSVGDIPGAQKALRSAGLPAWHWLQHWYEALIALADDRPEHTAGATSDTDGTGNAGDVQSEGTGGSGSTGGSGGRIAEAAARFAAVRAALPGELVPRLALGLCAELVGDLEAAEVQYGTVFGISPALGAAGFGLARVRLLAGRRAEAVATAQRLAQEFRYKPQARTAAVRLLVTAPCARDGDEAARTVPAPADIEQAGTALEGLDVSEAAKAALRAEVRYAAFLRTRDRGALSEAVRDLAPFAVTEPAYVRLIDLANRLRPPLPPPRLRRFVRWPRRTRRPEDSARNV